MALVAHRANRDRICRVKVVVKKEIGLCESLIHLLVERGAGGLCSRRWPSWRASKQGRKVWPSNWWEDLRRASPHRFCRGYSDRA